VEVNRKSEFESLPVAQAESLGWREEVAGAGPNVRWREE